MGSNGATGCGTSSSLCGTKITFNITGTYTGILVTASATNFVTIRGFQFIPGHDNAYGASVEFTGASNEIAFRIHDCYFWDNGFHPGRHLIPRNVLGLIDHNYFDEDNTTNSIQMLSTFGALASEAGYLAWTLPLGRGTANNIFIEDNTFDAGTNQNESAIDGFTGSRVVIRMNHFTNTHAGFHGLDSGGYRAPVSIENYGNHFTQNSRAQNAAVNRGGTAVYFDNVWDGAYAWQAISLQYTGRTTSQ